MKTKKTAPKKTKTAVVAKKPAAKSKTSAVKKVVKVAKKKVVKKNKTIPAVKKIVQAKKTGSKKEPTIKRVAYMVLSIFLGLLIGEFVHLFIELVYMKKIMAVGGVLKTSYFLGMASFLPMPVEPLFLLAGLLLGIWIGITGWRVVYIEHRHRIFQ